MQTAGEALNFNPHSHGLLASGTFDASGKSTPLAAIDSEHIAERFRDHVMAELVTRGLITDEVPAQILSQEHSGFGAWVGDSFTEQERTRFVARYIERGPLSLEKLSITDEREILRIAESLRVRLSHLFSNNNERPRLGESRDGYLAHRLHQKCGRHHHKSSSTKFRPMTSGRNSAPADLRPVLSQVPVLPLTRGPILTLPQPKEFQIQLFALLSEPACLTKRISHLMPSNSLNY